MSGSRARLRGSATEGVLMGFAASWVLNLVGQLGGDHQQAAQQLQGMDQVDPQQHAGLSSPGFDGGFQLPLSRLLGEGVASVLDLELDRRDEADLAV